MVLTTTASFFLSGCMGIALTSAGRYFPPVPLSQLVSAVTATATTAVVIVHGSCPLYLVGSLPSKHAPTAQVNGADLDNTIMISSAKYAYCASQDCAPQFFVPTEPFRR